MKNTIFQTSAFRVDNVDKFMQKDCVALTCNAMAMAKIPWEIGNNYISFCLTDGFMQGSDFDEGNLPTQDTIIELLELIERHIVDSCSVTFISNEVGSTVNCYQMEVRAGETTFGNFVGIDSKNVFGSITPEPISGISPTD